MLFCCPAAPVAAQESGEQEASGERNRLHILALTDLEEELKTLERLGSLKLWDAVAANYARILQNYSDKVVRAEEGRYLSAELFLRQELKKLPEEGKRALRFRFDLPAKRLLEKAKESLNTELLQEIPRRYPLSSASEQSLSILGDIALERGEYTQAASYYDSLLDSLPAGEGEGKILLLKALAAFSCADQSKRAEELLVKAKKLPQPPAGWSDVRLSGFLQNLPRAHASEGYSESLTAPDACYTVGASNTRSRNSSSSPRLGKKLWSASFFPETQSRVRFGFGGYAVVERKFDEFNYCPTFADGKLFCATESALFIRDITGGRLRAECPSPLSAGQFLAPDIIVAPVLADLGQDQGKLVFVNFLIEVTPGEDFYGIAAKVPMPRRGLFAVHPDSGKIAWVASDDRVFKKAFESKSWSFGSPPLVSGRTLFAELKVRGQMVTSYVVAFDALRGTMKWSVPLVSNGTELTMFGFDAREPLSTMITSSEDEKTLFVCTSMGAVCALDASTGAIRWITEYSQIPLRAARGYYTQPRALSFANCPPLLVGNALIIAPLDSRYIYAFDTLTGKIKWRVKFDDYECSLKYVVGIFGANVILAGNQVVAIDLESGKLRWKAFERAILVLLGHPAIGGSIIYLPTTDTILLVDAKTGKLVSQEKFYGSGDLRENRTGAEDYEPGNISIFGSRILITGKDRITLYEGAEKP